MCPFAPAATFKVRFKYQAYAYAPPKILAEHRDRFDD